MEYTRMIGMLADAPESIRQTILADGSCSIDMRTLKITWLPNLPKPFLEITMPCGQYRLYMLGEIPRKSVRCPCGDSSHWFIKYERGVQQPSFNISPN